MAGNAGRAPAPRRGLRRRRRGPRASAGAISANPSCYGTRHGRPCPGPDTASGPPEQGTGPAGGTRGEHSPKPRGYHAGGRLPATHSHAAPTRPWCCSQRERDRMSEQEGRGRGGRVPPVAHSPRVAHPEHQWGCGHCAPGSLSGSTGRVTPIPKGCRTGTRSPSATGNGITNARPRRLGSKLVRPLNRGALKAGLSEDVGAALETPRASPSPQQERARHGVGCCGARRGSAVTTSAVGREVQRVREPAALVTMAAVRAGDPRDAGGARVTSMVIML